MTRWGPPLDSLPALPAGFFPHSAATAGRTTAFETQTANSKSAQARAHSHPYLFRTCLLASRYGIVGAVASSKFGGQKDEFAPTGVGREDWMPTSPDVLEQARQAAQAGDLPRAELLALQIVESEADHAEAW